MKLLSPATDPRVLIMSPMWAELEAIVRELLLLPNERGFSGEISGQSVSAMTTGVGAERMVAAVSAQLERGIPSRLVLVGFAGALDPSLQIGDVPRLDWIIDGRGGAVRLTGGVPELASDKDRPAGEATLLSMGQIVDTVAGKRRLWQQHGAIMADMESYHVAELAAQRGVPLKVLRAVSDTAGQALPASSADWIHPDGSTNAMAAALWLFQRPWRLRLLLHLRQGALTAGKSLATGVAQTFAHPRQADDHLAIPAVR